ncbi:Hypothetical protein CINCED_3A019115 [Cinara cedri]|uniref:Uncharacterized protein n=1 Tax=Cinara cedri TaxID=506608 RepID=A0A5E4LZY7_9HEMI|nr:Hypothetical protein CINCED_3A019115 [Cinara cedri]
MTPVASGGHRRIPVKDLEKNRRVQPDNSTSLGPQFVKKIFLSLPAAMTDLRQLNE